MTSPGLTSWRFPGRHAPAAKRGACCPTQRNQPARHAPFGYGRRARKAWARRGGAAGLAAVTAVVLAACSGQDSVPLPSRAQQASAPPPSATPSPSSSPLPPRRAMIAAYTGFWPARDRAERASNAARARAILGGYAAPAFTRSIISDFRGSWRRHEFAAGHMIDHIKRARVLTAVNGQQAGIIVDCQNAGHHHLLRAGRTVPGSRGPRRARLYATLTLRHGKWLIQQIEFTGEQC